MRELVVTILAGGKGERLWPVSRRKVPKPFQVLMGRRSLLQQTVQRVRGLVPSKRIFLVLPREYHALARKDLPQLGKNNLITEPLARDTAPAILLATQVVTERLGNGVMAVLPSDHYIEPAEAFHRAIRAAARRAQESGCIYTLGVRAKEPATQFGYMEEGALVGEQDGLREFAVRRFHEKPDLATARQFVREGRFFWNCGIFVFRTDVMLAAFQTHLKEMFEAIHYAKSLRNGFKKIRPLSLDYGILERSDQVRVMEAPFLWDDLGTWDQVIPYWRKISQGNALHGRGTFRDAENSGIFNAEPKEGVWLFGVKDVVVVRVKGKTLVMGRDRAHDLKQLVTDLKEQER